MCREIMARSSHQICSPNLHYIFVDIIVCSITSGQCSDMEIDCFWPEHVTWLWIYHLLPVLWCETPPFGPSYDEFAHFSLLSECWPWEILSVMDIKWQPRTVHGDPNDAASRYSPTWMLCFNITTVTPLPETIWEMSYFQHLQGLDAVRNWIRHPKLTLYTVWARRHVTCFH